MREQDALSMRIAPLVGVEARIYDDLWNAIADHRLRPGAKLEEVVLCEIYGVSRTVIRKVLVILEQEGIVSLPVNRGAYVALPSPEDVRELNEATTSSVAYVARKLAEDPKRITPGQRKELARHVEAEKVALEAHDVQALRRLRVEFGTLLALVHGNRTLARCFERNASRFSIGVCEYQEHSPLGATTEFCRTLRDLILAGKPDEAEQFISAHGEATLRSLRLDAAGDDSDLKTILGLGIERRGSCSEALAMRA